MSEFLRRFGFDSSPSQPRQQEPPPGYAYQPSPYASPAPGGPAVRSSPYANNPHVGYHQDPRSAHSHPQAQVPRAYPPSSLHTPSPAVSSARSPQPNGARSPAPAANTSSQSSSQMDDWNNASVEELKSEQARREHTLSVFESRLQHCFDGGDADGAGVAASNIAREKKILRELIQLIAWKERRQAAEQRVRQQITNKFSSEKATVEEHRRQVLALKQRLRLAFALPGARAANSSPPPISSNTPPPGSSNSQPSEASLFDVLSRVKVDVGRAQVSLEHQCLHVDSIEMQVLIDAANANDMKDVNEGEAAHPSPSPSPVMWSEELTGFFKSSRKDVVTSLQSVLTQVDELTRHLKQTEAFMEYLKPEQ